MLGFFPLGTVPLGAMPPAPVVDVASAITIIVDDQFAAATPVSICSNALILLGANPIASFDDNTNGAKIMSNLYAQVRNEVVRSHPWSCCVKRVVLSPDVDAPAFGYGYAFTLPGDFRRLLSIDNEAGRGSGSYYGPLARRGYFGDDPDYQIEGRKILADRNQLFLRYVFDNFVEATYDALLVNALTVKMAWRACYAVTASTSLMQAFAADFEEAMKTARGVNGQEKPPETFGGNSLLLAARAR